MNIGSRRASTPSAPPIPVPARPPSAYGISVPGAPAVPAQQGFPPPPPPPAAAAPANSYAPVTPTPDSSGFFGGPVAAAAPSQFGSYGQTTTAAQYGGFGQPSPYAMPHGGVASAKAKPVKAIAAAGVAAVVLLGVFAGPRVMDVLHRHHTTTLPQTLDGYSVPAGYDTAAGLAAMKSSMPDEVTNSISHLQMNAYLQGTTALLAATGDLPAGSQRRAAKFFRDTDGSPMGHVVASPSSFGGSVRCATESMAATQASACVWLDDGTFGMVIMTTSEDEALIALQSLRAAVER